MLCLLPVNVAAQTVSVIPKIPIGQKQTQINAGPVAVTTNSRLYYKIGGARSISLPANPAAKTTTLGGAAELGIGYSCGKFDETLGVANLLNSLSNSGNNLVNGAVGAINAAIGSLPALILQRVNPGLYDLFQNSLIRVEAVLALANKNCQQMEAEIAKGKNPYEDWTTLAKGIKWKSQMGTGGFGSSSVDVKTAQDNVETSNGDEGIPWVGGIRAGGAGSQAPIRATYDIVTAGYNITLNRNVSDQSPISVTPQSPPLVQVWDSPKKAGDWAVDVLGEARIQTHDGRNTETTPGHGLLPKIHLANTQILQTLSQLVSGTLPLQLKNLVAVSSDDILVTGELIEAIQAMEPTEQSIIIGKLASEIAMTRTLGRAILIRRLLLTGKREPNVDKTPAIQYIEDSVAQLDREIDGILFEAQVRQALLANTSQLLVEVEGMERGGTKSREEEKFRDTKRVINGATR